MRLSVNKENILLHEQIIEKALSTWVEFRTPAVTGKHHPSGLEGH